MRYGNRLMSIVLSVVLVVGLCPGEGLAAESTSPSLHTADLPGESEFWNWFDYMTDPSGDQNKLPGEAQFWDWFNHQINKGKSDSSSDYLDVDSNTAVHSLTEQFFVSQADEGSQDVDITYDWGWGMLLGDARAGYSNKLATACLVLAGATEYSGERAETIAHEMGFNAKSANYGVSNSIDVPAATYGYRKVSTASGERNVFLVAVRGTSSIQDVLTDLTSVADGFQRPAANVKEALEVFMHKATGEDLDSLKAQDNVFLLTGHSLGGATVNHLACDLSEYADDSNVFAYTFACPTTTNNRASKPNVLNVVSNSDHIPMVPPTHGYRNGIDKRFTPAWDNGAFCEAFKSLTGKDWAIQSGFFANGGIFGVFTTRLLNNHVVETYMAHLLAEKGRGAGYDASYSADGSVRVVCVKCPVDVEVRSGGDLLGRISGNAIDVDSGLYVPIFVDGDSKYVVLPSDVEYDVRLTGTDSGSMDCDFTTVGMALGEAKNRSSYENVALAKGKLMSVELAGGESTESARLLVLDEEGQPAFEVAADGSEKPVTSIAKASVSVPAATFSGKAQQPAVKVALGRVMLEAGRDYSVSYADAEGNLVTPSALKAAGTYQVVVRGLGSYAGKAYGAFKIKKAKNPIIAKAAKNQFEVSAKKLKKFKQKVAKPVTVKKAKGKVTFANASKGKAAKAFKVAKKTGAITVPKKTKPGTYKVLVKATAKGNGNYKKGSKVVALKAVVR